MLQFVFICVYLINVYLIIVVQYDRKNMGSHLYFVVRYLLSSQTKKLNLLVMKDLFIFSKVLSIAISE